jgi:hypothetical protein
MYLELRPPLIENDVWSGAMVPDSPAPDWRDCLSVFVGVSHARGMGTILIDVMLPGRLERHQPDHHLITGRSDLNTRSGAHEDNRCS